MNGSATWSVPRTLQELAEQIVGVVRQHERNCRHCAPMPCVECDDCRAALERAILDALRTVNRR